MTSKKISGFYANSRQASLFVYPDGSWGREGFNTYINSQSGGAMGKEAKKLLSRVSRKQRKKFGARSKYSFKPRFLREVFGEGSLKKIKDMGSGIKLEKIRKYSSKYAGALSNILSARQNKKNVFIYNSLVQGSGTILFELLLQLFGFMKYRGGQNLEPRPRYINLEGENLSKLLERFNRDDNMNGEYIGVILGSKKIAEGFTFRNIQVEEILTPWYNYAIIDQAIARGYRLGSHRALQELGQEPSLNIYQRVSIPLREGKEQPSLSVDLRSYKFAEDKDLLIKKMERLILESTWDCALNFERNRNPLSSKQNNSRECEYQSCDYKCWGIEKMELDPEDIIWDTWQIYYSTPLIKKIELVILDMFRTHFRLTLSQISNILEEKLGSRPREWITLNALNNLVVQNKSIPNKWGFSSYLRYDKNTFFLVNNMNALSTIWDNWYNIYPCTQGAPPKKGELDDFVENVKNLFDPTSQGRGGGIKKSTSQITTDIIRRITQSPGRENPKESKY